jgi:hypothetical protein
VYTWEKLKSDVLYLYGEKRSLRAVARLYGSPINHADIQRVLEGKETKNVKKRLAFGLPAYALAPVCPKCGDLHYPRRCMKKRKKAYCVPQLYEFHPIEF